MTYPEFQLTTPVVIQPQVSSADVAVTKIEETPSMRRVQAEVSVGGRVQMLVLWAGDAYDSIGQWTDEDVELRVKELLENS